MKKMLITTFVLLLLISLVGCADNYKIEEGGPGETQDTSGITSQEPPAQPTVDSSGMGSDRIGSFRGELVGWPLDENGLPISYEYNGGEIELTLSIDADGLVDSVGVLMYLDGTPIPYRLTSNGEETAYFHMLRGISGRTDAAFGAAFTPAGFFMGDTATLTVAFVPCADYIYDPSDPNAVIDTDRNFLSRNCSSFSRSIRFNADALEQNGQSATAIPFAKNATRTVQTDINAFVDEMNAIVYAHSQPKLTVADIGDNGMLHYVEYYDGVWVDTEMICTTGKDTIHLKYKAAGPDGMEVKLGFSLGYQPTLIDGSSTYAFTLHKGECTIVEMDLDVSAITQPTKLLCEWFADDHLYDTTILLLYPDSTQGA
ncbi:MAG TPA: hypothetical protein VN608_10565 [Clostridia bacterium]|nr:hypothetical protein [Clostridia bacterium]